MTNAAQQAWIDGALWALQDQGNTITVYLIDEVKKNVPKGLAEPEKLTEPQVPQIGDLVRVRVGAQGDGGISHVYCEGLEGTLERVDDLYAVPGHTGPLSDFEKVEKN